MRTVVVEWRFPNLMRKSVKKVPDAMRDAFYAGARSSALPYCVNDKVQVIVGKHSGGKGLVISVESAGDDPEYLVELADIGEDVVLPSSVLRFDSDNPPTS
jgi:hypothetical protein